MDRTTHSRKRLLLLTLLLLYTCPAGVIGAVNVTPYKFSFFEASDGLAESWSVHATLRRNGEVWVSHGDIQRASYLYGFPMADGKFARTIPSPGYMNKILEDDAGRLWSVDGRFVHYYDNEAWMSFPIRSDADSVHASDDPDRRYVPSIPLDEREILFALPEALKKFDRENQTRTVLLEASGIRLGAFTDLIRSRRGRFWLAGDLGVAGFNLTPDHEIVDLKFHALGQGYEGFDALVENHSGEILSVALNTATLVRELLRVDGAEPRKLSGQTGNIIRGWPGIDDGYWVWKENDNLAFIQNGREYLQERKGILAGDFRNVTCGRDGSFWLCTSHGMIFATPQLWRKPNSFENSGQRISSICEDKEGRMWFGAMGNLIRMDSRSWSIYPLPGDMKIANFSTQSVCAMEDGRLALATSNPTRHILLFDPESRNFEEFPFRTERADLDCIGVIAPGRNGSIWVQARPRADIHIFRIETFDGRQFTPVLDMGSDWGIGALRYIFEASNGDLWLGGLSEAGIGLYRNGHYRVFTPREGYDGGGVFAIAETPEGNIWVGGRDAIHEYNGREWRRVADGLATVREISPPADGEIWVASGKGINRYFDGSWITYTAEDGLPNTSAFSVHRDSRGRVWAGTISGLSLYRPEADTDTPETFIPAQGNLPEVPPDGNMRILFSGVDRWKFTPSERLLFSWRLDNGPWSPFRSLGLAEYQGLGYGEHTFEVRAMDLNKNQDSSPAAFSFRVLLPWYRETGFQIILGVSALIISLMGFATYRSLVLRKLVSRHAHELQTTNVKLKSYVQKLRRAEKTLKKDHEIQRIMLNNERILARIAALLNSTDSFYETLDELVYTIGSATGLNAIGVHAFPDNGKGGLEPLAVWSSMKEVSGRSSSRINELLGLPAIMDAVTAGEPYISHDGNSSGPEDLPGPSGEDHDSVCILPIRTLRRVEGTISFHKLGPANWQSSDINLFSTIADMIANASQRYSLLRERLEADRKRTEAIQIAEKSRRMASIGVMAAGIVHEINQPLNAIRITADSVSIWGNDNPAALPRSFRNRLNKLSVCVERIDEIIRHMRSFWISPGQIVKEQFDLGEGVRSALSLLESQLSSHRIELTLLGGEEKFLIVGNRIHLEQIVINLVVNAMHSLDQADKPEKRIVIKIFRMNNDAIVEVIDNGSGLPDNDTEDLFDPFFSTKRPGEGTGLGLAIVKSFVEHFEGGVKARNNDFGGAVFSVALPLKREKNLKERRS